MLPEVVGFWPGDFDNKKITALHKLQSGCVQCCLLTDEDAEEILALGNTNLSFWSDDGTVFSSADYLNSTERIMFHMRPKPGQCPDEGF